MSRVAYVDVFGDERGPTCASFLGDAAAWFARQGIRIERVMTDNAKNYTLSHDFQAALSDIRASRLTIAACATDATSSFLASCRTPIASRVCT
jgi:hypothetical protein